MRGDHSLRTDLDAVAAAVRSWLAEVAEVRGYNGPPRRDSRVAKGGGL